MQPAALIDAGTSFVALPGAAALQVRASDEHHVLAAWRNLAVVIWVRDTQVPAVSGVGRLLSELTSGDRCAGLLQIVHTSAVMPSTGAREAITALLKLNHNLLFASAVVFEGEGFRAAAARAVVSGIAFMTRLSFPHEIFASVPAALAWLDERQPERGAARRDRLEQAIAQLRGTLSASP